MCDWKIILTPYAFLGTSKSLSGTSRDLVNIPTPPRTCVGKIFILFLKKRRKIQEYFRWPSLQKKNNNNTSGGKKDLKKLTNYPQMRPKECDINGIPYRGAQHFPQQKEISSPAASVLDTNRPLSSPSRPQGHREITHSKQYRVHGINKRNSINSNRVYVFI